MHNVPRIRKSRNSFKLKPKNQFPKLIHSKIDINNLSNPPMAYTHGIKLPIRSKLSIPSKSVSNNSIPDRPLPLWIRKITKFEIFCTSKELMSLTVQTKTEKHYRSAGNEFYGWLKNQQQINPNLPDLKILLNTFAILQLDKLIYTFLTDKFNATQVRGGTLHNNACGILYCLACDYGVAISCGSLNGVSKICKGADGKLKQVFGEHRIGKYPLLNPMIEAMLPHATPKEQFAIMTAQRFCLRSQHYCHNRNKKVKNPKPFIKRCDFHFIPNIRNPRAVSISTSHDKNNPNLEHMERVVYCTCGKSNWT